MKIYDDLNKEKQIQISIKNKNEFKKIKDHQYNSNKSKHFNNFFSNIIKGQLKFEYINNASNFNDNNSFTKNELLHQSFKEKNFFDKNLIFKNHNELDVIQSNNDNFLLKTKAKGKYFKSNIKNYKNFNSESKLNDKINIKLSYKNKKKIAQNKYTINIDIKNKTIKDTLISQTQKSSNKKINSRNNSYVLSKTILNNNNSLYKTYRFKKLHINNQQLPKDALNGLLLFLKKNKKHLAKTSKYHNVYKKYKNFIDQSDKTLNNNKKSKNINNRNINIGYYGRKPFKGFNIYDMTYTFRNKYSNKSEKNRHEIILDELNRLKGYIEKNQKEKYLIIKDFLNKYNINYKNKDQLKEFESLINNFNKYNLNNSLKPYLGIKEMILDFFKEGEKIYKNIILKTEEDKNYDKNNISIYNLKNSNIINYKQYNQIGSTIYKSPFLKRQKYLYSEADSPNENRNLKISNLYSEKKKNNKNYNIFNNNIKSFDLLKTNCYLKKLENQKRLFYPNKDYSSNYNLIVDEIGEELKELNSNIKYDKQYKITEYLLKPNKRYTSTRSNISNENVFITSNKTGFDKNFSLHNTLYEKINQKSNESNFSVDKIRKRRNNKKNVTQRIINKLNLKPKLNSIGIEDIKKRLKLTEYIVLSNAKKKLMFENIEKNELYEYVNKGNKHNKI